MAHNLCKAFSIVKSNIFNECLTQNLRCFNSLQTSIFRLSNSRFPNIITPNAKILKTKRTITTFLPLRCEKIDVNTNVANNVVLFKYENPSYFKNLSYFSIFQFFMFCGISWLMHDFVSSRRENETFFEYLKRDIFSWLLVLVPLTTGVLGCIMIYAMTVRNVKYIILKKGGQKVTVATYHPIKGTIQITVPVEQASVKRSRKELNRYMSVKLAPKRFYYVIQKEGTFVNTQLYDATIGALKPYQKKKTENK